MKSPFVKELQPNQLITTSFLVQAKEIRQKKTGEPYLSLLLGDRTGEVEAKMWDNVGEVMDTFERDDFVKVKGLIQIYHNRAQLTVHKMRRLSEAEVDFNDFFPASERCTTEMWKELREIVSGMGNPHLKALLNAVLDDDEIARRYRTAPAAKHVHHAFLGGLIEHVLSVCQLARLAASHYKNVDLDLLITGAILHDIGKIRELSYERGFGYTSEGQLLGHMVIALGIIGDKLRNLTEFPPPLRALVEHMIISHHGKLEFGSPKLPQFPEALLLHYLDDMDSKMECMRSLLERDRQVDGCFTSYSSLLERVILKKTKYLLAVEASVEATAVEPAAPPAPAANPASHPLFTAKSASPFGDKLMQALRPAGPGQET